jgi:hypothetical protein
MWLMAQEDVIKSLFVSAFQKWAWAEAGVYPG